eukprot:s3945_g6.t1
MPVIALTAEQEEQTLELVDSDLKYLLSEVGIPDALQATLYHRGFTSLRLFSGIDESRAEVRAAINAEIGLDHTANNVERRQMALILSAWETARTQQKSNDEARAEARMALTPWPVPLSEHAMLREALENQVGRLKDYEIPSKAFVSAKLDDIELNQPRLEDLRDIAPMEDGDADLLQGNLDASTGTFKMRAARATIQMPKTAEELRWETILAYEQEVRKRAYQWVRRGDVATLEEALEKGVKDAEVMNLHFIIPLTTSLAGSSGSGGGGRTQTKVTTTPTAKGSGKGHNRGGAKPAKKLHVKTPDGRPLCFKYNNNGKCTSAKCSFVHQCQRCFGSHPKSACNSLKGDTAKATPGAEAAS